MPCRVLRCEAVLWGVLYVCSDGYDETIAVFCGEEELVLCAYDVTSHFWSRYCVVSLAVLCVRYRTLADDF